MTYICLSASTIHFKSFPASLNSKGSCWRLLLPLCNILQTHEHDEFNELKWAAALTIYSSSWFLINLSSSETRFNDTVITFFADLDENSCPINIYNQSDSNNNNTTISSHKQKKYLQLLNNSNSSGASMFGSAGSMRNCSFYNGSQPKSFSQQSDSGSSTSSLSDLDEITIVKEEPLSPHSSCPPSPNSNYNNTLPSISSINPDLMYDRKVTIDTWTLLSWAEIYGRY